MESIYMLATLKFKQWGLGFDIFNLIMQLITFNIKLHIPITNIEYFRFFGYT